MVKDSKRKLLFMTLLLMLLLVSSSCAVLAPSVKAAEMTNQEKALSILTNVVGLDTAKYSITSKEGPQNSYLGAVTQENIRYTLNSNTSNMDVRYTFANGKLRMIHLPDSYGVPHLTKTATNTLEMAKSFLQDYQSYSRNSFYGELGSLLSETDAGKNLTKTSGNIKLKTTSTKDYEIYKWAYTYNDIEAPSKCVALGYKNGFLKYFLDNWDLYTIGSTNVNISEEEAIDTAMACARSFSWSVGADNNTFKVENFNVTNAMVWETLFCSNLYADTPRSQDPLMLYPIRHIWVSLDKFYPGNVYGINVYVWADTGEICYVHERVSTLDPPPELVASTDEFKVEFVNDEPQLGTISSSLMVSPTLAFATLITILVWFLLSRERNSTRKRFSRLAGTLSCILLFSSILLFPISTVNATSSKTRAEIWGSESAGAYDSRLGGSWRKSSGEISMQRTLSGWLSTYFDANGYDINNSQGDASLKGLVLNNVSYNDANYPRVAVVYFDHGIGTTTYVQNEWHYMIEDNYGTYVGSPEDPGPTMNEHAITDMDIYPRTAQGKVFFAFINTCLSANTTYGQGFVPGTDRARGLPFAWSHRRPGIDMSTNGYASPDAGDFCYIGFPWGSAALDQPISNGTYTLMNYADWVYEFFVHALQEDISVITAMDEASIDCFTVPFGYTPLDNGFDAEWPMWHPDNPGDGWKIKPYEDSQLVVYGNGNIHLYQKGGIWNLDENDGTTAHDSLFNNNGTIHGATWTTGKFGSALSFDGSDDNVEVYPFEYDFKEITAEFWMKTSDTTKTGTPISCSEGPQPGDEQNEFLIYNYQSFRIYIKNSWVNTGVSANDGDWHHIAVTWRSSDGRVKLYKDGTSVYSGTLQTGATINLANIIIGQEQDSFGGGFDSNQAFKGIMDEVRIYSYVLSASQIADNAAVAVYHLNDGNAYDPHNLNGVNAYDSAPYDNAGTLCGGTSWTTGVRGSASSFDGSGDYIDIPDDNSLDIANAVTVEAWIKPSRLNVWQSPLEKGEHNNWAYGFYIEPAGGNIGFEIGVEGQPVVGVSAIESVNSYLEVGKWTYIAGTADSATGKVRLYIDGEEVDDKDFNGQINQNSLPFQIGKRDDGGDFGGVIDEVRIYDRALSGDEISAHYSEMLPTIFRELTVLATNQYSQYGYVPLYIDGQEVGTTGYTYLVVPGNHWIGVPSPIYGTYQGHFYMATFQYFYYDSTENEDNPMNLLIAADKTVTAHYYMEMLY